MVKSFFRIFKLLYEVNKLYLFLLILLNLINGFIPFIILIETSNFINKITLKMEPNIIWHQFIVLTFVICLGIAINIISSYFHNIYNEYLSRNINNLIISKTLTLSYSCFENSTIYDKLQRARSDAVLQVNVFLSTLLQIIAQIAQVISLISILATSTIENIWIICLIPILLIIPYKYGTKIQYSITKKQASRKRSQIYLMNLLSRNDFIKEIKAFDFGNFLFDKYKKNYSSLVKENIYLYKLKVKLNTILRIIIVIIMIYLQTKVIYKCITGSILIGTLVLYFQTISQVEQVTSNLLTSFFTIYQCSLFVNMLFEFLDITYEENDLLGSDFSEERNNKINKLSFKDVYFKYPNSNDYALSNITFEVYSGEKLAILGHNGSGKSTIIKLLLRLHESQNGQILYNDVPIQNYSLKSWRKEISTVFQEFIKLELTLEDNIIIGNLDSRNNMEKVNLAINNSTVADFITLLPDHLKTQLGVKFNSGKELSHGEWQKIAIARFFFRNSSLLLLDEPTSALDKKSEKQIVKNLNNLYKNKIIIYITHDFDNVKYADKILVLNRGKIVGFGNHDLLMKNCEFYSSNYIKYGSEKYG
mgnify:CR=1 FL=1|jgi:ABC-type multidrug transport system fused ATPase/permease subunit